MRCLFWQKQKLLTSCLIGEQKLTGKLTERELWTAGEPISPTGRQGLGSKWALPLSLPDSPGREASYRLKGNTFLNIVEGMLQEKVAQKGRKILRLTSEN